MPSILLPLVVVCLVIALTALSLSLLVFLKIRSGWIHHSIKADLNERKDEIDELKRQVAATPVLGAAEIEEIICKSLNLDYRSATRNGTSLRQGLELIFDEYQQGTEGELENFRRELAGVRSSTAQPAASPVGSDTFSALLEEAAILEEKQDEFGKRLADLEGKQNEQLDQVLYTLYQKEFGEAACAWALQTLEHRLPQYDQLAAELEKSRSSWSAHMDSAQQHSVVGETHDSMKLSLNEFAEVAQKLSQTVKEAQLLLRDAHRAIQKPLPELFEKDKENIVGVLGERHRMLRTIAIEVSKQQSCLRDTAVEFHKPLQTVWAGISQGGDAGGSSAYRNLLTILKDLFNSAGLDIVEPEVGQGIDESRTTYRFHPGTTHSSRVQPLVVSSVISLGLVVEDFIQKAVVYAENDAARDMKGIG